MRALSSKVGSVISDGAVALRYELWQSAKRAEFLKAGVAHAHAGSGTEYPQSNSEKNSGDVMLHANTLI